MAAQNRVTPTDLPVLAGPRRFFAGWRGLGGSGCSLRSLMVAGGVTLQLLGPPPASAGSAAGRQPGAGASPRSAATEPAKPAPQQAANVPVGATARSRHTRPDRRSRPGLAGTGARVGIRRACRASPRTGACRCRSMPPGSTAARGGRGSACCWPASGSIRRRARRPSARCPAASRWRSRPMPATRRNCWLPRGPPSTSICCRSRWSRRDFR